MRGGIHVDQRGLTGGVEGLGRLVKAYLSSGWILASMREWADDPVCHPISILFQDARADDQFYVEMSDQLQNTPAIRWKLQADPLLHNPDPSSGAEWSVWDLMIERYTTLGERGEEMIVRLITAEVETDLKKHLQRYVLFPLFR